MQKIILFLSIVSLILLASCAEDYDIFIPDPLTGDIRTFYDNTQPVYESFIIENDAGNTILFEDKMQIVLPALAFSDSNGNDVSSVEIRYFSAASNGDFIRNQFVTQHDDLVSTPLFVGKFEIYKASSQSHTQEDLLTFKNNVAITVHVPHNEADAVVDLLVYKNGAFEAAEQDISDTSWTYEDGQSSQEVSGYVVEIGNEEWYYLGAEDRQNTANIDISVKLPSLYDDVNTDVYVISQDALSVSRHTQVDSDNVFSVSYRGNINEPVTVVVVANLGDEVHHFGTSEFTILEPSHSLVLIPIATDKVDILSFLESL